MDTLKIQISQLQDKTDRLYELVEQMNNRVDLLSNSQSSTEPESYSLPNFTSGVSSDKKRSDYQLTHKDVLVDDNNSSNSTKSNSENLAPETQIRRLTAQLTAAYNRIAALEEQLLTYRIHS